MDIPVLVDVQHRIEQMPLSPKKALMPLFEAISNSINAIDEAKIANGRIVITIQRTQEQGVLTENSEPIRSQPVCGFEIEDNGVGFNDDNLKSFQTVFSGKKKTKGGKGQGRLLWLKAFAKAEIDSTFQEDGSLKRRTIDYSLENPSLTKLEDHSGGTIRKTVVRLKNYLPQYESGCPTGFETIARRIIGHFIQVFLGKMCPEIILVDPAEGMVNVDLKRHFKTKLQIEHRPQVRFQIEGQQFAIEHLRLTALPESVHELHFCGAGRSVIAENLSDTLPFLRGPLQDNEGKSFVYAACISGSLLTEKVDDLRNVFLLPNEGELESQQTVTWQALQKKAVEKASEFLAPYLDPIKTQNRRRIEDYIKTDPKYRPLAKHRPEWFDRITPGLSNEQIEIELHKLSREYDQELLEQRPSRRTAKTAASIKGHKAKFANWLTAWNDQGLSKLADYVIHRRATLDFLDDSLKLADTDKHAAEDQIHSIVCPLKTSSHDVPADQLNLWVIDERLAYHRYLASDQQHRQIRMINSESADRADLLFFMDACAFGNKEFDSVVIVEFKRPMRDDYTDEKNPMTQVLDYVKKLRSGREQTFDGRPLPEFKATPFYAFVVCDLTPTLRVVADDKDFHETPDGQGYYSYHSKHNVFIEVMSYQKLLDSARKRNAAFFDKLNLDKDPIPVG